MIEKIKSNPTLLDFWAFIKKPNDVQYVVSFKEKLKTFGILLALELVFTVLLVLPFQYLLEKVLKLKGIAFDYNRSLYFSLLVFVILIPLVEEFIFRHFLRYKWLKIDIISKEKWLKNFPFFVYFFVIAFGLVHVTNYKNTGILFYSLAPFIVASQLSGGLIMTYLRVRFNFSWGVYYHAVWNLIFVVILPFITFLFYNPYAVKTKEYSLTITETPFYDNDISIKKKLVMANGNIQSIHFREKTLQHLLDTLFTKNQYYVDEAIIDLKFDAKNGISKEAFLKLIEQEYEVNNAE